MAFPWWADGGPFLVAFRSSLTTPSDKMFWIRACMQCVWTDLIEIKLSTDIIHARIQKVLSKGIRLWQRLFLKLMGGGRTHVPLWADHHRPASETPSKAFCWHADECPTLNAGLAAAIFQGIRTYIAITPIFLWFFSDFLVCGSGPWSAHVISRYFGTYNVRQRLRRACASVHFQYSIDGSGMSSITALCWMVH